MGGEQVFTNISGGRSAAIITRKPPKPSHASPCVGSSTNNLVLGSAPTRLEVDKAVSELQRFMHGISNQKSGPNWPQGLNQYDPVMLQSPGFLKLLDAFSMMQNEPAVQNIVTSIASDKGVWQAILSNKAVQDLQGSISAAGQDRTERSAEDRIGSLILNWLVGFTKSKLLELVEKFVELLNEIFRTPVKEKPTSELNDLLEEKVRSSFLLVVVILIIIIVSRNHS